MAKFEIRINPDTCKGCELCFSVCPKNIICKSQNINNKGYHPAVVSSNDDCIGCKACALICPDGAISIFKEDAVK